MTRFDTLDALQLAAEVYASLPDAMHCRANEESGHAGLTDTVAVYVFASINAMIQSHGSTAAFYHAAAESPRVGVPVYDVAELIAAAISADTTPEHTAEAVLALLA
jgi:hypothetical protein